MRAATIGEATVLARLSLATADQLELWADRVLDAGVHRISAHAQTDVLANRLMQAGASSKHMRHDPILEELWAVRAQLNAQANYDVKRLLADAAATAARMTDANGQLRLDA